MLLRFRLSAAPRFLWVGIELGCAGLEGGGLPSLPFRSARRVHNSPKAAFPEHRAFTANCSSWVSSSRKGVSRDGSSELREIQIP